MSALKKLSLILVALAMMLGLVAASAAPAAAAVSCSQWHTVQRGEYLVMIARMYDTDWRTLAELNDLDNPSRIYPGQKLCVSTGKSTSGGSPTPVATPVSGSGLRVYALSVEEDESVTLRGKSLWANARYTVSLSRYDNKVFSSVVVGSAYTDKNGAFTATYAIPKELVDVARIEVRLDNGRGDAATNWFINATADDYTGGEGSPAFSFSLVSVEEDEWVKIKTSNLPANVTFNALMGKAGSKGVDGISVGSLRSDDGGSVRATFEIPADLQGRSKIDLRLENKALGIYYYMTLFNEDTP